MAGHHTGVNSLPSAHDARVVVPSDTTVLPTTRFLYIGTTGDVTVRMALGTDITFKSVPVGILRVQVDKVYSTSTTATNILALY